MPWVEGFCFKRLEKTYQVIHSCWCFLLFHSFVVVLGVSLSIHTANILWHTHTHLAFAHGKPNAMIASCCIQWVTILQLSRPHFLWASPWVSTRGGGVWEGRRFLTGMALKMVDLSGNNLVESWRQGCCISSTSMGWDQYIHLFWSIKMNTLPNSNIAAENRPSQMISTNEFPNQPTPFSRAILVLWEDGKCIQKQRFFHPSPRKILAWDPLARIPQSW